jgi:hypothetical protein
MRAHDYHLPLSTIDPDRIVVTRVVDGRRFDVIDVGDNRYRLAEGGTIVYPRIDPWAADRPPTVRLIRALLHPRKDAFAALMDRYGIRANDHYQYEDTYEAMYSPRALGRWVAVSGDATYHRIVNTRSVRAGCDVLAEAVGFEYLGLPIAVVDLDTGTSAPFRVIVRLTQPTLPTRRRTPAVPIADPRTASAASS